MVLHMHISRTANNNRRQKRKITPSLYRAATQQQSVHKVRCWCCILANAAALHLRPQRLRQRETTVIFFRAREQCVCICVSKAFAVNNTRVS